MMVAEIDERIFEIVDQFNRGVSLIDLPNERERVAELYLIAGKRAKDLTACSSALAYFTTGRGLLSDDNWAGQYRLLFELEIHRAECEYLTGVFASAENRLSALAQRATELVDRAAVARQRISLYTVLDRLDRATDVSIEFLSQVDIHWSPHPTSDDVDREYAQIWQRLGGRSNEELVHLPLMTDPGWRATVDVLVASASPARFMDSNLSSLILGRIINLSLKHGHTDGSCFAYVYSDLGVGAHFGDYRSGFRFAKLGFDLMESHKLFRFKPRVYVGFALSSSWVKHLSANDALLRRAFAGGARGRRRRFHGIRAAHVADKPDRPRCAPGRDGGRGRARARIRTQSAVWSRLRHCQRATRPDPDVARAHDGFRLVQRQ